MKNICIAILSILFTTIVLNACKDYSKTETQTGRTDSLINTTASSVDTAHRHGASLIAGNDCITCHSIDKKMFGPSFVEIATKYNHDEKLAEYLANNVIKGSRGIYGNNAMTPHPNLKYNDIIAMTKYILSVQKTQ